MLTGKLLKQYLESQVGRRVQYTGSSAPDVCLVPGDQGEVLHVDDQPAITVQWDSGFTLGLLPNIDRWTLLPRGDNKPHPKQ